jgi:anti-sigma regulatory factor (Ser/Thr protein kinase)
MGGREATRDIAIEVRSEPQLLQSIRNLIRGYVMSFGIARERVDEIVLAVDEACCNSIRHSYRGDNSKRLYLTLTSAPGMLEVELRDEGVPAPADRIARRELEPPNLDDLTPGGLGVPLIYKVFDEVEFIPGERQGNRVIMRVRDGHPKPGAGHDVP